MNDYNKAATTLVESILSIVSKALSNATFDRTYPAIVREEVPCDNSKYRKYRLETNGIEKVVLCTQPHQVDERVYVLVPRGDWNHARIITTE